MIDYHSHMAALNHLRATLGSGLSGDPSLAGRVAELAAAVAADPDAAALGACIDHVTAHASADGTELQILETAADLWTRGLSLYDQLTSCRQGVETALQHPSDPGSVQTFQSAVDSLDGLRTSLRQFAGEAQLLQSTIAPLPHLEEHPRQTDTPAKNWDIGNLFAARRTDAYVRAAFERAATDREKAFAFGVLSSYAGNVAGSAYLGQAVGGPRRSHRFRDRLARNTVGAWMHSAFGTPSTTALGKQVAYRGLFNNVALPADLRALALFAFKTAYPHHAAPDLDLGLRRMVRHLQLLDAFQRPPLPDPPPIVLASAGEVTGTLTIMSDDLKPPSVGVSVDPDMTPNSPGQPDSSRSGGSICLAIILVVLTIGIALLIYCIGKWTTGKKCKASDFFDEFQGSSEPDPHAPTGTTLSQLTAMGAPDVAAHITQELYNFQLLLWQAFDLAFAYLAATGLIYPDDLIMSSPLYKQFVTTPGRQAWPHRPEPQPAETYHLDPTSGIEQPAATAPLFPSSAPPGTLFATWLAGDEQHAVLPIAHRLLLQMLRHERDSENYDLDADRGFLHPCWECAPGTSIAAPVLSVQVLPYTAD